MANHSVRAVEQRLSRLERDRENALTRAREIAESVADGRRSDDAQSEADYSAAKRDIETLGNRIQETRWDLEAAREDESKRDALAATLSRTGMESNFMTSVPQSEARYGRPFGQGQGFADLAPSQKTPAEAGAYLRALLRDDVEARATMTEGTGSNGGYLVPVAYSSPLLDLARAKSRIFEAGARMIPLDSDETRIPRHDVDPTFTWRSEAGAVTESGVTLGQVVMKPQMASTLIRSSIELVEDSGVDFETYVAEVIAAAAGVLMDREALYGTGVSPAVKGLKNTAGVVVTDLATDGAALSNHDALVDLVGRVRGKGYDVSAMLTSPRLEASLGKLREGSGTGQYLAMPKYLQNVPLLSTRNVPTDLSVGTSGAVCTDVIAGDFSKLLVGVRHELSVQVLREKFADTGEFGFIAHLRMDVQVSRPAALEVLSGITN